MRSSCQNETRDVTGEEFYTLPYLSERYSVSAHLLFLGFVPYYVMYVVQGACVTRSFDCMV